MYFSKELPLIQRVVVRLMIEKTDLIEDDWLAVNKTNRRLDEVCSLNIRDSRSKLFRVRLIPQDV